MLLVLLTVNCHNFGFSIVSKREKRERFWFSLSVKFCEVFLCFVAIVRVKVYYVDFFVFFVLRHWRVLQVFTPRMSRVFGKRLISSKRWRLDSSLERSSISHWVLKNTKCKRMIALNCCLYISSQCVLGSVLNAGESLVEAFRPKLIGLPRDSISWIFSYRFCRVFKSRKRGNHWKRQFRYIRFWLGGSGRE